MDTGTEIIMVKAQNNIQECDMRGGVFCELDGKMIVEPFKDGGEVFRLSRK